MDSPQLQEKYYGQFLNK